MANRWTIRTRPQAPAQAILRRRRHQARSPAAGTTHFREQMAYGLFVPMVREEQSLLFSICPACRRVRTCTEREQPRRKIVRRRQATRTSRPHSRKWRVAGYYLPSKWSGWSVRTRPKREARNLCRAHVLPSGALVQRTVPVNAQEGSRGPAFELQERSGGVRVSATPTRHAMFMLEIAITLIVGFALGYGVRALTFRQSHQGRQRRRRPF